LATNFYPTWINASRWYSQYGSGSPSPLAGEIYSGNPSANGIPSRHFIWLKCGCRELEVYVLSPVSCFLVIDWKIVAFKVDRSFICIIRREIMILDLFCFPSKGVVADLNRDTC
jgi:hypothetical protein